MICPNCQSENSENTKFCVKCGNPINIQPQNNINFNNANNVLQEQPISNNINNINVSNQNIVQSNVQQTSSQKISIPITSYFYILLAIVLKPYSSLKEEINKFDDIKNSIILSVIVSIFSTIISLFTTIINTVRVKKSIFSDTYEWVWSNIKDIEFIKVIGTNFLISLGVIMVISLVYYVASIIIKKQAKFPRILAIVSAGTIPLLVCIYVISPILGLISSTIGLVVSIVGFLYTYIILYESINNEIILEGNSKYYFNLICLTIIIVVIPYILLKIFFGDMISISDLF